MVVGAFAIETDLLVIGAGPAGLAAAHRGAALGLQTTIVEPRAHLGGTWTNGGGLALRVLTQTIEAHRRLHGDAPPPLDAIASSIRSAIESESAWIRSRCDTAAITIVEGRASFESARAVEIHGNPNVPSVRFRRAVITTGTRAPAEEPNTITFADTAALVERPSEVEISESTPAALALAGALAACGARVRVNVDTDDVLTAIDTALRDPLVASLRAAGVSFGAGSGAAGPRITGTSSGVDTDGLTLGRTGVVLDADAWISVDDAMRTADPRLFAAGAATGFEPNPAAAAMQGRVAAEVIAGHDASYDPVAVPYVVGTAPPLAWCGARLEACRSAGVPVEHATVAWADLELDPGVHESACTQLIWEPGTDRIVGFGAFGPGADEAAAAAVVTIEMGGTLTDLAGMISLPGTGTSVSAAVARHILDRR